MCKVDSLIRKHDLEVPGADYESVEDYLETRWIGADDRSPQGYRTLADWFNKRVLAAIYDRHDRSAVSVHLDREYDLLTDEESLDRAELEADLSAYGIDGDAVRADLVSGSTMHNHLRECTGVEKEVERADRESTWQLEEYDVAKNLARSKVDATLSSLASSGRLPRAADADVTVDVKFTCPECSTRVPFDVALERGYICREHSPDPRTTDDAPDDQAAEDAPDASTSVGPDDAGESTGSRNDLSLGIGGFLVLNHLLFVLLHLATTSSHVTPLDAVTFGAT